MISLFLRGGGLPHGDAKTKEMGAGGGVCAPRFLARAAGARRSCATWHCWHCVQLGILLSEFKVHSDGRAGSQLRSLQEAHPCVKTRGRKSWAAVHLRRRSRAPMFLSPLVRKSNFSRGCITSGLTHRQVPLEQRPLCLSVCLYLSASLACSVLALSLSCSLALSALSLPHALSLPSLLSPSLSKFPRPSRESMCEHRAQRVRT